MYDRIAVAVLALIATVAALTFRDYGLGWDDYTHSQYGDLLLAFYGSGFKDRRALEFVNLYLYGGGFDMAAALLGKILPFDLFETRRLAGAAVGILGLAVTWRIARRVAGPRAGLIALLLLATCPLYYGHMFINPKDTPFAVAMAILLLGLVRALDEYPRPSWPTVLILALGSTPLIPHYRAGKLVLLGQSTATRAASLPEVPTFRESGMPDLVVEQWLGVFVPAGTPPPIVARLNSEIGKSLADPAIKNNLEKSAQEPVGGTADAFGQLVKNDHAKYGRLVKDLNLKVQ